MIGILIHRPSLWKLLTPYTGFTAVGLLVLVLSLNPLQRLFQTSIFIKKMNCFRREIGVSAFIYAMIHFFCFFIKRKYSISETLFYFSHPGVLPGVIALFIFGVLSLTSNNFSIKKMGFLKWKRLHKTVYVVEGLLFIHMVVLENTLYACLIFGPLVALQFLRKTKRKGV